MSRRLAVLIVLLGCFHLARPAAGQDASDTPTSRPTPPVVARPSDGSGLQAPRRTVQQPATSTDTNAAPDESAPSTQPQIIVNPPAPAPTVWGWREQVTWGATIVLAVLGYVGILLALRTLKSIDKHLQSGSSTTQAAMDSASAALALAQAIANSERPWIVVTVEPFLTMENSFKVMASNRGRSPARIISSVDQVKVAVDETNLPKVPEFEAIEPGDEPEPIVLLPGEATGIWALNREDLPAICKEAEVLKKVERWQETLFLYGRIQYLELAALGEAHMHETFWCCRYIHGEKSSALVMAGPPAYNKHS
ncbi:MAG: hypothetical protein WBV28_14600 [Terracidiphilus sp.]